MKKAADVKGVTPQLVLDANLLKLLDNKTNIALLVYNPLAWNITSYVKLPVFVANVRVTDSQGVLQQSQVNLSPSSSPGPCQSEYTCGYPEVVSPYELFFQVELPPLGFNTYILSVTDNWNEEKCGKNMVKICLRQ